jgi:hypothetical protein
MKEIYRIGILNFDPEKSNKKFVINYTTAKEM